MKRYILFLMLSLMVTTLSFAAHMPYVGHRQLETERFIIIHEPHDEWAAREITTFAEEVLDQLSSLLEHTPERKIPVIISSRPAHANGYFSPIPPKIVMYITSSEGRFMGSRTSDWLRSLFVHELAHYVHLTAPVGPAKYLAPIFGPAVPAMNTVFMPGWWVEGITTYAESTYAAGGRGDAPRFSLTYDAPIAQGNMWSLAKGAYGSQFPPSGRIYSTGFLMVEHLMRTYGDHTFSQINRSFAAWPFFGMSGPFERTVGKHANEVFLEAIQARSEKLTLHASLPALYSPDTIGDFPLPFPTERGLVGFGRTHEKNGAIYLYHGAGSITTLVSFLPIGSTHPLGVTPDGSTAYLSFAWADPHDRASIEMAQVGYADLYRVDLHSGSFDRLTTKQRLMHPAVSPDGTKLVAVEPFGTGYRLLQVDLETLEKKTLHEPRAGAAILEPSFSPDGTKVVAIEIENGRSTLVLIDENKRVSRLWAHDTPELHNPRFIDDRTIWFSSDLGGKLSLFSHDLGQSLTTRILDDPVGILGAIPYGEQVVYATYFSQGHALREIPLSRLYREPASFGTTEIDVRTDVFEVSDAPTTRYYDTPRFNLWLPIPLRTGTLLTPGASVLMQSLLGRHTLGISAAWDFKDALPLATAFHLFQGGKANVETSGAWNNGESGGTRYHTLSSQVTVPLWRNSSIEGTYTITSSAALGGYFFENETIGTIFGYIGYGFSSPSAPKNYYGRFRYSVLTSVQHDRNLASGNSRTIPIVRLSAQVPVMRTHHALSFQFDTAYVGPGFTRNILLPDLFTVQTKQGEAKSLATVRYRIPLGPLDQPIPFGGIIGAGLSLHAQSALYLSGGSLDWEEDVYLGLTFNADIAIGGAITLRPSASFAVSAATGAMNYSLGLGVETLFGAQARPMWNILPEE